MVMNAPKMNAKTKKFNPNRTFAPPTKTFSPNASFTPKGQSLQPAPPTDALELASLYHPPLHPLQYNTYAPTPFRSHFNALNPHERTPADLFLNEKTRQELQNRNEATLQILPASTLPDFVHVYHSLMPLDMGPGNEDNALFGRDTYHYKAVSHNNGQTYCLIRIDGFEINNENEFALQVTNKWKRVQSASCVNVIEAFTTLAFNSNATDPVQSLVVVYEYWPLAQPLSTLTYPTDQSLWTIAAQIYSAIQAVHRRQLVVGDVLKPKYVLLNNNDRVRLSTLAVADILNFQTPTEDSQKDDLVRFGSLMKKLCKTATTVSPGIKELIEALEGKDVERIDALLIPQIYRLADNALSQVDSLEDDLSKELENGRLVRLLSKLETVITEEDYNPSSPNYVLTLFKAYVFQQKTPDNKPSLNLAHSLICLNKLDVGVDESVLLTSKDGRTRIVISYKDLRDKFSSAFDELVKAKI